MATKIKPIHPGKIIQTEFLDPMGITKYRLAKSTGLTADRIGKIVHGQRPITAQTALRLSRFFGNSSQFWMNLQSRYDLEIASDQLGKTLDKQVTPWSEFAA